MFIKSQYFKFSYNKLTKWIFIKFQRQRQDYSKYNIQKYALMNNNGWMLSFNNRKSILLKEKY